MYAEMVRNRLQTGLETRDDESADREELHRLSSTLPIEKVRELLKELR